MKNSWKRKEEKNTDEADYIVELDNIEEDEKIAVDYDKF